MRRSRPPTQETLQGEEGEGRRGCGWGRGGSLRLTDGLPVHEVSQPGGEICHDPGGSEVKGPLKVLVLVQHPDVDLPHTHAHTQYDGLKLAAAPW